MNIVADKSNKVLSFDVGIKNLAYCLYDPATQDIISWDCINIGGDNFDHTSENLFRSLDDIFLQHEFESLTVLIENQPVFKAPTMKSIQIMIYSYFKLLDVHGQCNNRVILVSATKKNKYMKGAGYPIAPKDYKSNKKNSVKCVEDWLEKNQKSWFSVLQHHKKKDDLCDALLQIIVHIAL